MYMNTATYLHVRVCTCIQDLFGGRACQGKDQESLAKGTVPQLYTYMYIYVHICMCVSEMLRCAPDEMDVLH